VIAFTIGIGNAEYGYDELAMNELRCIADSGPESQNVDDRVMMIGSYEQTGNLNEQQSTNEYYGYEFVLFIAKKFLHRGGSVHQSHHRDSQRAYLQRQSTRA
jgi:hypothetical protein